MKEEIVVSVLIITYNHERFISKTIESALSQITDFKFEIVIGEDFGTDKTREICESYQKQYPEIIKLLPSEKNWGVNPNFIRTHKECKGKYVALCEGDDFWTDSNKLKKQVDYLENNKEFSFCFHDVDRVNVDGEVIEKNISQANNLEKNIYSRKDLIFLGYFANTLAFLYRKDFEIPKWFEQLSMGDKPLVKLLGTKGKGYYFNEVMGAYREHENGITKKDKEFSNPIRSQIIKVNLFIYTNLLAHVDVKSDSNETEVINECIDWWDFQNTVRASNKSLIERFILVFSRFKYLRSNNTSFKEIIRMILIPNRM